MFHGVRMKMTALVVSVVLLLYLLSTFSVYALVQRSVFLETDSFLQVAARRLIHPAQMILLGTKTILFTRRFKVAGELLPKPTFVLIRRPDGQVMMATHSPTQLPENLQADRLIFSTMKLGDVYKRVVTIPLATNRGVVLGYLQAGMSINRELDLLHKLRAAMELVGTLGALLALVAGLLTSKKALQPIVRSWQRQREFVADASHEIRTPLAVIQSNLDLVLGHADESVMDNLEWLNHAQSEVRRLGRLTQDLLTLARTDSDQVDVLQEAVDVTAVGRQVVDTMYPLALAKGIDMIMDTHDSHANAGDCVIVGDAKRLYQLVMILIDNAIKYTPSGGKIEIRIRKIRRNVELRIEDTGMGIPKEDVDRIFDRFYRSQKSRETAGTGLGLAIAAWIVEHHHGKIHVESLMGQGTTFIITFPTSKKPPI